MRLCRRAAGKASEESLLAEETLRFAQGDILADASRDLIKPADALFKQASVGLAAKESNGNKRESNKTVKALDACVRPPSSN